MADRTSWLMLAFQLPSQPAYLRVKVWRRLQDVGALSFRNSVWLLPSGEGAMEDFEWILREVREGGGEGAIFESQVVAGASDETIRALFDAAREEDYRALAEELRLAGAGRRRGAAPAPETSAQLARIRRRLAEIEQIDYFAASGRTQVHALLERLEERAASPPQEITPMTAPLHASNLRGRTWVTRAHVQVDRMASAWLIRRWIDPEARFRFVTQRTYDAAAGELRFDMFEAEYTHDGERCTFEVLLDLLERKDAALTAIAEIVHDLDLKDRKYEREETAGVKQLLAGITAKHESDEERLERSAMVFDDLHAAFTHGQKGVRS